MAADAAASKLSAASQDSGIKHLSISIRKDLKEVIEGLASIHEKVDYRRGFKALKRNMCQARRKGKLLALLLRTHLKIKPLNDAFRVLCRRHNPEIVIPKKATNLVRALESILKAR
jgi:hypothetical protein